MLWRKMKKGAFLVRDNCVFKGSIGRSLRLFTHTTYSAHSLRSTRLCYARARSPPLLVTFTGSLTHFAHYQWEQTRFSSSLETRPKENKFQTFPISTFSCFFYFYLWTYFLYLLSLKGETRDKSKIKPKTGRKTRTVGQGQYYSTSKQTNNSFFTPTLLTTTIKL